MKYIYFLSGLPRAGNTLLSSILNENPNIYATGKSANVEIMHRIFSIKEADIYKEYPQEIGVDNILENYFSNFYKNIKEDYVIERGEWITPYNLSVLSNYCPNNIKIVVMTRKIEDIIKSFLGVAKRNKNYYINQQYNLSSNDLDYKNEIDFKVDLIMQNTHLINMIASIHKIQESNMIKFIDYDDLVTDTVNVIKSIYQFYEIEYFEHNLKNIKQLKGYNDEYFYNDTHTINTKEIAKRNLEINLPKHIVSKYKQYNLDF
jgi:hypothetical protein